jgi:hypothetical protein
MSRTLFWSPSPTEIPLATTLEWEKAPEEEETQERKEREEEFTVEGSQSTRAS